MKTLMSLNRFEAFSNGVFAIAMTLLVIEIKLPELSQATPSEAIREMLHIIPHLLSYVTSFLVIGVVWLNHHALFHFLKRVDRITLTINLILLMCVAFILYSTALIGNYGKLQPVIAFYGSSLTITGSVYNLLWFYVVRQYLWKDRHHRKFIFYASLWSIGYPILYGLATLLSWFNTTVSIILYVLIPLFYLFPSAVDYQLTNMTRLENRSIDQVRDEILPQLYTGASFAQVGTYGGGDLYEVKQGNLLGYAVLSKKSLGLATYVVEWNHNPNPASSQTAGAPAGGAQ